MSNKNNPEKKHMDLIESYRKKWPNETANVSNKELLSIASHEFIQLLFELSKAQTAIADLSQNLISDTANKATKLMLDQFNNDYK